MNPLAVELNKALEGTVAGRLMSTMGQRLYFPKGIIAQGAEAKKSATVANGTIGMAYTNGKPMILSAIAECLPGLSAEEIVVYAPTAGVEKTRTVWRDQMIKKNPSLDPATISLPVVTPGLTAGLSYTADLFLDKGYGLIASEPCWDNYTLIFEERREAALVPVAFVNATREGLDMEAIGAAVRQMAQSGTVRIIFNYPNNPAGYSPTVAEAAALVSLIREVADGGADVLVICDDAYYGMFYEDGIAPESLFACFANLHERVLAIKIDGPIKEDFVWGLRIGFLTFGSKGLNQAHYDALVKKMMGAIRSSVSCVNTSAQHIVLKAAEDSRSSGEKAAYREMLRRRYKLVKDFVNANPGHPVLKPLPCSSGYFMSFCSSVDAEALRVELLSKHGIGTISLGPNYLRLAFSSLEEDKITMVLRQIYDTAAALA
jgi:aspartate/methionine/tyrosine aminotransferase